MPVLTTVAGFGGRPDATGWTRLADETLLNHPGFRVHLLFREAWQMSSSYIPEIRAKAVRLVREHGNEYDTE